MVEAGLAFTEAPVVELNPVDGDHEKDVAPPAFNVVEEPAQIAGGLLTVTTGIELTVTVTKAVSVQPPEFQITL